LNNRIIITSKRIDYSAGLGEDSYGFLSFKTRIYVYTAERIVSFKLTKYSNVPRLTFNHSFVNRRYNYSQSLRVRSSLRSRFRNTNKSMSLFLNVTDPNETFSIDILRAVLNIDIFALFAWDRNVYDYNLLYEEYALCSLITFEWNAARMEQ